MSAALPEMNEDSAALPFDKNKQFAILGHLLSNDRFFLQARGKLLPKWFVDPWSTKVLEQKCLFYEQMKRCPTTMELENVREVQLWEQRERNKYLEAIRLSSVYSAEFKLDALSNELTEWLHAQIYFNSVRQSTILYNAKKTRDAYSILDKAVTDIKNTSFEADDEQRFDSYRTDFESAQHEYSNALTTGLTVFDRLLTPKASKGSLLPGDTSIILASTNTGKTTSMITVAKHNVWDRKSVLFITHEGRPGDIKEKLWCSMLDCSAQELMGWKDEKGVRHLGLYETKEGRDKLDFVMQYLNRCITYVPMNKAGLTVEEVARCIRRRQEERVSKKGKGYDLLIDDYPAKLWTEKANTSSLPKRSIDEVVYNTFVQLGLEYNFHVLCAIQTNREGSKVNKGQREDRLLTMEDVQESWGPMTAATNVWSINRDPTAKANKRLTYYIDKSRSSEVGWAIVARENFAHSITHSDTLGATYYKGHSTYSEKLNSLLEQYAGKGEIPDHELYG